MFFCLLKGFFGEFIDAMLQNFKVVQNALIQAIRKVSLINSVYTYTNNFTFNEALLGVLGIRDKWTNNSRDKG